MVPPLKSILEGVGHAIEFHGNEFFVGLFVQHIEMSPDFMCSLMIEIGQNISWVGCLLRVGVSFKIGVPQW
jgi:hypothetical protein